MSDREWRLHIDDTILFAANVVACTDGMGRDEYVSTSLDHAMTMPNPERMGKGATPVPDGIRGANAGMPWRMIIATRKRISDKVVRTTGPEFGASMRQPNPAWITQSGQLWCTGVQATYTGPSSHPDVPHQLRAGRPLPVPGR
jgi:uncharacterized protein with HEPN domain